MSALLDQIALAIAALGCADDLELALHTALAQAERARTDPAHLDAMIAASLALWDVPLTPDGARILAAINHLGFGNESAASAALADEEVQS